MEWSQWKKHIFDESLKPLYVIHGEEKQLQNEIYQALKQRAFSGGMGDWNWNVLYATKDLELGAILETVASSGWGSDGRIVVVRNCETAAAEVWNGLVKWLDSSQPGSTLALFFQNLDGRTSWAKAITRIAAVIECKSYKGDALLRYAMDQASGLGMDLPSEAARALLTYTGSELAFVQRELEKLAMVVYPEKTITVEAVHEAASTAPGQLEHGAIFRMTDAMSSRNCKEAVRILHQLIDAGEAPLRILPLIERQLRLLLAAKTKGNQPWDQVAKAMGENSEYPVKKAGRFCGHFSEEVLLEGFSRVIRADRDLKLSSHGEDVLEELILWICTQ